MGRICYVLCHIRDYVTFFIMSHSFGIMSFGIMLFGIMSHLELWHLALCCIQTYVVWHCVVRLNVVRVNVIWRNVLGPTVGVSQSQMYREGGSESTHLNRDGYFATINVSYCKQNYNFCTLVKLKITKEEEK